MSRVCQSCGGIIGRDCFNPEECQWIADQMNREQNTPPSVPREAKRLQDAYAELSKIVEAKNIEVAEYRNALQGLHNCAKLPYESFAMKGVRDLLDKYKNK